MSVTERGKDIRIKLAFTDTDLLEVLRNRPPRGKRRENSGKSNVTARYSPSEGTLTFSGVFRERVPIYFKLKQGSRTYGNFIKFLIREIQAVDWDEPRAQPFPQAGNLFEELTRSLEENLSFLDREARESVNDISEIVDVFGADFEEFRNSAIDRIEEGESPRLAISRGRSQETNGKSAEAHPVFKFELPVPERKFRLIDSAVAGSQLISGFFSIEIEGIDQDADTAPAGGDLVSQLSESFQLVTPLKVQQSGKSLIAELEFSLEPELLKVSELILHWGPSGDSAEGFGQRQLWTDEEVPLAEIMETSPGIYSFSYPIYPETTGVYGFAVAISPVGSAERIWASHFQSGDFIVAFDTTQSEHDREDTVAWSRDYRDSLVRQVDAVEKILRGLSSYEEFVRAIGRLSRNSLLRNLGLLIADTVRHDPLLCQRVSQFYRQAVLELESKDESAAKVSKSRLRQVTTTLQNIGIGEVVFVAPEGPHAIAGGLAQVVVGLSKALVRQGVSCTIVTPIYEEGQGNKHRSFEEILKSGVHLMGKNCAVTYRGIVRVAIGPTRDSTTGEVHALPRKIAVEVYEASHDGLRVLFLRHRRYANKLYASVSGDEQLRRAIFLSRGALEVLRDPQFGVEPHIVITNDWPSALVPVYLKADEVYSEDRRLKNVDVVHVIHNGGRAYQGRFFTQQFGEDLWPLLGLDDDHYFGLSEPGDRTHLNLTAGAVFHGRKGLVAVSRPYARQLKTSLAGDGLESLYQARADSLFGISNGIDLSALRTIFWQLGETARFELGLEPLLQGRITPAKLKKAMPFYKKAAKRVVQRKLGLIEDQKALVISMVGRLAEQKGIQLLSGSAKVGGPSVLESILERYPHVQFILGGPPTIGDPEYPRFEQVVRDLEQRYPGRIAGVLDFIQHQYALEITQSSDLFLMPSRYEPGGITQLEALAAGTPVVARNVGGIAATLVDFCRVRKTGNSFLFSEFSCQALEDVLDKAIKVLAAPEERERIISQAYLAENDWSHRVPQYLTVFQNVSGLFDDAGKNLTYLRPRSHLLNSIRA